MGDKENPGGGRERDNVDTHDNVHSATVTKAKKVSSTLNTLVEDFIENEETEREREGEDDG